MSWWDIFTRATKPTEAEPEPEPFFHASEPAGGIMERLRRNGLLDDTDTRAAPPDQRDADRVFVRLTGGPWGDPGDS